MDLYNEVQNLKREIEDLKRNRLGDLSANDVENLKKYLINRTASTLASGATVRYLVLTINGERGAVPFYDKFTA